MRARALLVLLCIIQTGVAGDFTIGKTDAAGALRAALNQGASKAVDSLSRSGGFLLNPEVKIPLPPQLQGVERLLRRFGLGAMADELIGTMNQAAEAAVPEAKDLLLGAIKSMTIADARNILVGGNDAATQYFRSRTEGALAQKFKPIVASATARAGVAQAYHSLTSKVVQYGLIDEQTTNLDDYITAQALEGLFKMIAKEELAIRKDPLGQSNKLVQRVFGSLRTN